ncbi:hypothetical protein MGN70_009147 [Eutypa lata]|nr:hypothetical protein MGN70_009147 [Eutypa lata]
MMGFPNFASYVTFMALGVCAAPVAPSSGDWLSQSWDAIVVGAGTAGIIVADRLSEAGKKTLLLEVGDASYGVTGGTEKPDWLNGTDLSRVDVPGLYKSIFSGNTNLTCSSNVVNAYQGCTIGGTSAINAGLYFQPPASDWDLYHPDGWKSADVQAAIEKLLDRQPSITEYSQDNQFYLQSGYEAAEKWLVDAAGFSNVSLNDDPDNKDKVFGRPAYNYIDGQRGGPVRTYLQTALERNNFHLQTGVHVKYINQECGTATGLTVEVDGHLQTINITSKDRIVLSAGALVSPQILMYSGIGPEDTLTSLSNASFFQYDSSKWMVNPEVGKGLFDNPNTFIELSGPTIESYAHSYTDPVSTDRDLYLQSRSGPYSFASQTSVFFGYVPQGNGSKLGVQGTIDSSGFSGFNGNNTITLNIYGTSGLYSSGHVVLASDKNFTAGPSDNIYYADPRDGQSIATFIHDIFQALPESTPESPAEEGLTPLNLARNSTVEQIYTYITTPSEYAVGSVSHWSSSCRIGKCVDADTKVIGTQNIHVIDASILSPLSVNPQFGIMVAAEKGAERLLATWG